MPMYEYMCGDCKCNFDKLLRTHDDPTEAVCPDCGSAKTHRKQSVFAVGAQQPSRSPQRDCCGRCCGGDCALSD